MSLEVPENIKRGCTMSYSRHASRLGLLAAVLFAVVLPRVCRADGFIIIHDGPVVAGHFSFAPLEVTYHRVSVDVRDQVATTTVDQEFYNPNPRQLEGTYMFPLPEGSHIDKFSMDVNGKQTDAELLDAAKAKQIYEDVVRRSKDPALLEYVGRDAFKVRIFPIEPNSRKQVKITYTQLLKTDSGLTEYVYPLNTEKFSARPLHDVSVKVSLHCTQPIKSLYSPSHNVETKRTGDHDAVVGYEEREVRPDTDFKLIFTQNPKEIGINLLTYKNSSDDGYFLLLAAPGTDVKEAEIQPKDITFVLDTSGSMAGKKMDQARKALNFCLANLNEKDRFEVIRFSTDSEPLFNELRPATKENVSRATEFVEHLKAIGATAIDDALQLAIRDGTSPARTKDGATRPYVIIFLTDGRPTIGETREDAIIARMDKANAAGYRIFSFGIGTDVNTHLLDRIANDTQAFSTYVLPEEDLEVKLSNFYTKIKEPVLSGVKLAFSGSEIRTTKMYPNALPDLYKGQELVAFGRYSGHGAGAVKISGTLNGATREYTTDVNFVENDATNGFIPRLWATRRVGWLLDEIRLHGESAELKDEVVRLAREHGIVTPYTAFLIIEDENKRGVPVAAQNFHELKEDRLAIDVAGKAYNATKDEFHQEGLRTGGAAIERSRNVNALKSSANAQQAEQDQVTMSKSAGGGITLDRGYPASLAASPATQPTGLANGPMTVAGANTFSGGVNMPSQQNSNYGYRQAQNYAQQARVVRGRAFYQNNDIWTDSTIQANANLKRQEIKFGSDEYFALVKAHPEAAGWFALGNSVDVVLERTVYCVR